MPLLKVFPFFLQIKSVFYRNHTYRINFKIYFLHVSKNIFEEIPLTYNILKGKTTSKLEVIAKISLLQRIPKCVRIPKTEDSSCQNRTNRTLCEAFETHTRCSFARRVVLCVWTTAQRFENQRKLIKNCKNFKIIDFFVRKHDGQTRSSIKSKTMKTVNPLVGASPKSCFWGK